MKTLEPAQINLNKKKLFDQKMVTLITVQALLVLLLGGYVTWLIKTQASTANESLLNAHHSRELGNQMQSVGIQSEAIWAYENAIQQSQHQSAAEQAPLAFTIAELASAQGMWERALRWYSLAEKFSSSDETRGESRRKIVQILERLKKFESARYALQSGTQINPSANSSATAATAGGVVIAQIGSDKIYLHELNEAIELLPPEIQKQLGNSEAKRKFAQKLVADRLLYQKAMRQEMDKQPKVAKLLERAQQEILINQLLEEELGSNLNIDPKDLANYMKANNHKDLKQTELAYKREKIEASYQKLIDETLKVEKVELNLNAIK